MGNRSPSGLIKRGGIWHIDKVFRGTRIRETTSTSELTKAQEQLAKWIGQPRMQEPHDQQRALSGASHP
jgi:hypothetical protein